MANWDVESGNWGVEISKKDKRKKGILADNSVLSLQLKQNSPDHENYRSYPDHYS